MKTRKFRSVSSVETTAVTQNSLPPEFDLLDVPGISDAHFQRIVQSAEKGDLTEPELSQVRNDLHRAKGKRKDAILAGKFVEVASASSREQAIVRIIIPYAELGVRAGPGRKKGGMKTGEMRRQEGEQNEAEVHALATRLLDSHAPREISGIIMKRLKRSRTTVSKYLQTHPSGRWTKGKAS